MDDARAIEHLLHAYADAIDAGDLAAVGRLFRHGRICGEAPDGPVTLAEGAAAVEAFYRSTVRLYDDGTPRTRHLLSNVAVEPGPEPRTARAQASYTVFQATEGLPLQAIVVGRYRDAFRVIDDEWCFESRVLRIDLSGDLSRHLLT